MRASKDHHVLARLRKHLALTQEQLAEVVPCSVPTIQSIESGRLQLSAKMAEKISSLTGAPLEWLLANNLKSRFPKLSVERELGYWAGPWAVQALNIVSVDREFAILEKLKDEESLALFEHYRERYLTTLEEEFGPRPKGTENVAEARLSLMKRLTRFDPVNPSESPYRAVPKRLPRKAKRQSQPSP
jgi:transcriptional regulator with XRE-family HTH domain